MENAAGSGEDSNTTTTPTTTNNVTTAPAAGAAPEPAQLSTTLTAQPTPLPPRRHDSVRHHRKRLTLNFPINLPDEIRSESSCSSVTPSESTATSTSTSMAPTSQAASSNRPSPPLPVGTPVPFDQDRDDGYDFLTAIASQERKVLELREELQRAEAELVSLKKQWARSEKARKVTEISYRAEPLLPLKSADPRSSEDTTSVVPTSTGGGKDVAVVQARVSRDLERQNSVRTAKTAGTGTTISANGRRVFQGSHARALSLLSPLPGSSSQPGSDADDRSETERVAFARQPRSATLPSVDRGNTQTGFRATPPSHSAEHNHHHHHHTDIHSRDVLSQWRKSMPPPSREALMRTGRQMASDLKEGLWTFLEDIRQATVGDEGINATESRSVPAAASALGSSPGSSTATARRRDASATSSTSRNRDRDRLSVRGSGERSSRSPSSGRHTVTSGAGTGTMTTSINTGKDTTTPPSTDISTSFWSEFGVDTPGQKKSSSSTPAGNVRHLISRPPDNNNNNNNTHTHTSLSGRNGSTAAAAVIPRATSDDETTPSAIIDAVADDNWDMWDTSTTPQARKNNNNNKMHTPSSSRSTVGSTKHDHDHDQSPITQASSPRTSASFGDWTPTAAHNIKTTTNTESIIPDPSVSEGIPWPALTKLAPSKLARTASHLMAEWERSLSPSPSPSLEREREKKS